MFRYHALQREERVNHYKPPDVCHPPTQPLSLNHML